MSLQHILTRALAARMAEPHTAGDLAIIAAQTIREHGAARNHDRERLARHIRALLHERFPLAFARKGEDKRPLKISVAEDILLALPELKRGALSIALADYAHGPTYLRNMRAGAPLIDLNGEPCGEVTPLEAQIAAVRLRRFERNDERASLDARNPEPVHGG